MGKRLPPQADVRPPYIMAARSKAEAARLLEIEDMELLNAFEYHWVKYSPPWKAAIDDLQDALQSHRARRLVDRLRVGARAFMACVPKAETPFVGGFSEPERAAVGSTILHTLAAARELEEAIRALQDSDLYFAHPGAWRTGMATFLRQATDADLTGDRLALAAIACGAEEPAPDLDAWDLVRQRWKQAIRRASATPGTKGQGSLKSVRGKPTAIAANGRGERRPTGPPPSPHQVASPESRPRRSHPRAARRR